MTDTTSTVLLGRGDRLLDGVVEAETVTALLIGTSDASPATNEIEVVASWQRLCVDAVSLMLRSTARFQELVAADDADGAAARVILADSEPLFGEVDSWTAADGSELDPAADHAVVYPISDDTTQAGINQWLHRTEVGVRLRWSAVSGELTRWQRNQDVAGIIAQQMRNLFGQAGMLAQGEIDVEQVVRMDGVRAEGGRYSCIFTIVSEG